MRSTALSRWNVITFPSFENTQAFFVIRRICTALEDIVDNSVEASLGYDAANFLLWCIPRIEGHCKTGLPAKSKPFSGSATLVPGQFNFWRVHPKVRFPLLSSLMLIRD